MKKKIDKKKLLVSFIGNNDAGKLIGKNDGAILTLLSKRKFEEIHLLWNPSENKDINFYKIAKYVKSEIIKRGYSNEIILHAIELNNVTDHNEIYPKLLRFCKSLNLDENSEVYSAISSGTPSMQVCWILMAESGDFPLKLIRTNEPKFGGPVINEVKLGIGLPRVIRLETENKILKELIPNLTLNVEESKITIGESEVNFSPIQFCYYRYFIERARSLLKFQKFSGLDTPKDFLKKIISFHKESFPEANAYRQDLEKLFKNEYGLTNYTFRSNITKLNKSILKITKNIGVYNIFAVKAWGSRTNKHYGIDVPIEKIKII